MRTRRTTPGEAATANYLAMSRSLLAEARSADRHRRPLTAEILRGQARLPRRAAIAEETDPEPAGLGNVRWEPGQ